MWCFGLYVLGRYMMHSMDGKRGVSCGTCLCMEGVRSCGIYVYGHMFGDRSVKGVISQES